MVMSQFRVHLHVTEIKTSKWDEKNPFYTWISSRNEIKFERKPLVEYDYA